MEELYKHLVSSGVSPNGLFTLHAVHNDYQYKNYINFVTEKHRLEICGFLLDGKITDKGLHLLRECDKLLIREKKIKKENIPFADWEEQIIAYNELFPRGKKEGSSISFRTNPKELFDRFKWFFAEYPEYTWADVLTATQKYVYQFEEKSDFMYMQTSKYFIKKDDKNRSTSSNLATMCYNIAQGNDEDMTTGNFYFGP